MTFVVVVVVVVVGGGGGGDIFREETAQEGPRRPNISREAAQEARNKGRRQTPKRQPEKKVTGGSAVTFFVVPCGVPRRARRSLQEPATRLPVKNHSGDSGGLQVAGCFPGNCRRAEKADRKKVSGGSAVTFFLCASRRSPKGPKTAQEGPTYPGRPLKRLQTKEGARIRKGSPKKRSPEALR